MSSSDQEDEDLKAAIALSLAEANASFPDDNPSQVYRKQRDRPTLTASTQSGMTQLGLDRKTMEEERLARLKRKLERPISPPQRIRKAPKLDDETITERTITLPSGARLNMISSIVQNDQQKRKPAMANAADKRLKREASPLDVKVKVEAHDESDGLQYPSAALQYPHGVVKKTWAFGHERTGTDVKLEEVLEPRTLNTAVLSAFQWDTNWLLSKLRIPPNGGTTKCIFIMQGKEAAHRAEMYETVREMQSFLRLCFPPMEGQVHCMHSKLMLLFHPTKLRIAIPTANLLNFDWGETGLMENTVFMIDLPRLPPDHQPAATPADLPAFGQELLFFLDKQGLDQDVRAGVLNFDFRTTAPLAFVHTVGGTSFDRDAPRTGLAGLSAAVRQLGLRTDTLEIDFAASSIGSLNDTFLTHVHSAARGIDPIAAAKGPATATVTSSARSNFFAPASSHARSGGGSSSTANTQNVREHVRIYFPTAPTVRASTAGAAGTICLSRNWFEGPNFPRSCFRDYKSTRRGLLSHNKILCARGRQKDEVSGKVKDVAWVYVGSANMSESAWGKVSLNKKRGDVRVNCRNWECGVLWPVPEKDLRGQEEVKKEEKDVEVKKEKIEGEDSETESEDDAGNNGGRDEDSGLVGMDVFRNIIDLPFQVPGERYGGKEPWYFKE